MKKFLALTLVLALALAMLAGCSSAAPAAAPAPAPAASAPAVSSGSSTIISGFSDAEIDLYIRIVASECGAGWSYEGCLMVSQVIVNRMMSGRWGGLHGVLTAPNQFTPYGSGYYKSVTPTGTQRQAALDALNGATIFGRDVLYFCTDAAYVRSPWFQSLPVAATYANTYFFAP
jgi:spore germination cell wall hydrolase CwlJ-like protein